MIGGSHIRETKSLTRWGGSGRRTLPLNQRSHAVTRTNLLSEQNAQAYWVAQIHV